MSEATWIGALWYVMAFDCMKMDSLSLAKCWEANCGIGIMRNCEVVSVETFSNIHCGHVNCYLKLQKAALKLPIKWAWVLWLLCFWLNAHLWFQICRGELLFLGRSWIQTSPSLALTLSFLSLDDFRSLLHSQSLSVHRKTERKPRTFQNKTKPVRAAVNLKYCQYFNRVWQVR